MNNGYLSKPQKPNDAGVVLIHEFWGVNGQIKKTADRLASLGFTVLAVDLYQGKIAKNEDDAKKMKDSVTDEHAMEQVRRAILELEKYGDSEKKIAVWGFCFGGSVAFKAASSDIGAGAYVIYYGSRISEQKDLLANIQKPILGIFGGQDKSIPATKVEVMKNNLNLLGKINEVYIYTGAGHAFFNEERPAYHAEAAADAWDKTITFLRRHLLTK